jgi:AraC-like DNA-binding protein
MRDAPQTYRERRPAPHLAGHVACVFVQRVAADAAPYEHRTVPNGAAEIVWRLGDEPVVVGPRRTAVTEVLPAGSTVVGVRLRPGAAPAVLGLPASELTDLTVPARELLGATTDDPARLEELVAARVADGPPRDPLVAGLVRRIVNDPRAEVNALRSELYVSERHLRRRCLAAVGLAPKTLQRMLRFQGFLALAHARALPHGDLAALALDAGYADQPHLTRECLRLSGRTPRVLLTEAREQCHGVHDHRATYLPLLGRFVQDGRRARA